MRCIDKLLLIHSSYHTFNFLFFFCLHGQTAQAQSFELERARVMIHPSLPSLPSLFRQLRFKESVGKEHLQLSFWKINIGEFTKCFFNYCQYPLKTDTYIILGEVLCAPYGHSIITAPPPPLATVTKTTQQLKCIVVRWMEPYGDSETLDPY